MINRIKKNVWQLSFESFGSCVYLIKLNKNNILIDTSSLQNRNALIRDLKEIGIQKEKVNIIILTHKHFDHRKFRGF